MIEGFGFLLPLSVVVPGIAGIVVLVFFVLRYLEIRHKNRLHQFVEMNLASQLLPGYGLEVRRPLMVFVLLGCFFLLLAMAQPHWGKKWMPVTKTSRDILIVLDVSLSMNAENPPPTRLVRARQKIESFLEKCPADRFGLVVFAGEAATVCPLTLDHGYFRFILDAINTDTLSTEGSDLSAALLEAQKIFEADAARFGGREQNNRAVIILSDGEQTAGDAVAIAERIRTTARIFALGIGDPQGSVVTFPSWMRQYVGMPDDKLTHLSKLDEETLSKVALAGGGIYVRITPDNRDVQLVHNELEQIQGTLTQDTLRYRMVNRYRWPLMAAWVCFALEGFWQAGLPLRRRYRIQRLGGMSHA